ncbi:MAG TPA: hypothetical protein PKG49_08600 [Nitrosomonas mobilis]|nr:hypothetical protein [Nitrosomonas mobilis]
MKQHDSQQRQGHSLEAGWALQIPATTRHPRHHDTGTKPATPR